MGGCDPYVHTTVGASTAEHETHSLKQTSSPVWEEVFETEIELGVNMSVVMKVYDSNVGLDRLLGVVSLMIPQGECPVKRETLKLAGVPQTGWFRSTRPDSTLTVLYQVTTSLKGAPDLVQIGDMDEADLLPKICNLSIDVRRFRTRKPATKEEKLFLMIGLVDVQKHAAEAASRSAETAEGDGGAGAGGDDGDDDMSSGAKTAATPAIVLKQGTREAGWDNGGTDGHQILWTQELSRPDMLQRVLFHPPRATS
ncbi:unnamed protein product [Amoebophrya sp. A25]|nr:unnamed protein product [Amoebophrya sp. A25]|eukprot:GSA25T00016795001.1